MGGKKEGREKEKSLRIRIVTEKEEMPDSVIGVHREGKQIVKTREEVIPDLVGLTVGRNEGPEGVSVGTRVGDGGFIIGDNVGPEGLLDGMLEGFMDGGNVGVNDILGDPVALLVG